MIVDPSPAKKSKRSIRDMMTSNLLTMTKESLVENQKVFNDERQSCATQLFNKDVAVLDEGLSILNEA